jgi:TetR/AcrR family transcriptional repressor of nem operon
MTRRAGAPDARHRLLDAALGLFREKGYGATTVDQLCRAAGVTKGAFFHHFSTKETLGVAAVEHWSAVTDALFAAADYHHHRDPLDRVLAYLDLRADLVQGSAAEYSCVAGTAVQEIHASHPAIRVAADASIRGGAAHIEVHIAELLAACPVKGITAHGLALHVQGVIQGAFVLGKARNDAAVARESIAHLKRYVVLLFGRADGPARGRKGPVRPAARGGRSKEA